MTTARLRPRLALAPAVLQAGALTALGWALADTIIEGEFEHFLSHDLRVVGAFALVIALGEFRRFTLDGERYIAPLSLAASFALAMSSEAGRWSIADHGAGPILLVTFVAMVLGSLPHILRHEGLRGGELASRYLTVTVVAVTYRDLPMLRGETLISFAERDLTWNRGLLALIMLLVSGIALAAYIVMTASLTAASDHVSLSVALLDEARAGAGLSMAMAASGALVALADRPLGTIALPLFLLPLVFAQFAVRRYAKILDNYRQTVRTLARLTEVGGYTRPGHQERVAALSVAMGRDLGMSAREVRHLEYAALLHDIGQVGLRAPIPDGSTVMAAPADQDRIAAGGARIVSKSGVADQVAKALYSQAKPYRQVREFGEELPLMSRVIKVANAFDDIVGDAKDHRSVNAAVERIHLGLGYEYDPRVVDSLVTVLERRDGRPEARKELRPEPAFRLG